MIGAKRANWVDSLHLDPVRGGEKGEKPIRLRLSTLTSTLSGSGLGESSGTGTHPAITGRDHLIIHRSRARAFGVSP